MPTGAGGANDNTARTIQRVSVGIALGGMVESAPQILCRYVRKQGGAPQATVLAQSFKTSAPDAALVNGTAADIVGWSGISVIQMTHPSVSICPAVSFAGIAKAMGAEGVLVTILSDVGPALRVACDAQRDGRTTVLEVMVTCERGDPFRRDALSMPVRLLDKYKDYV